MYVFRQGSSVDVPFALSLNFEKKNVAFRFTFHLPSRMLLRTVPPFPPGIDRVGSLLFFCVRVGCKTSVFCICCDFRWNFPKVIFPYSIHLTRREKWCSYRFHEMSPTHLSRTERGPGEAVNCVSM